MQGAEKRVRPVMMTALTAIFGLLPAALSTKIGSQTQRPLAIVVVGGMITTLFLDALPDAGAVQLLRPPRTARVRRPHGALTAGSLWRGFGKATSFDGGHAFVCALLSPPVQCMASVQ